jgi:hypothetical protein
MIDSPTATNLSHHQQQQINDSNNEQLSPGLFLFNILPLEPCEVGFLDSGKFFVIILKLLFDTMNISLMFFPLKYIYEVNSGILLFSTFFLLMQLRFRYRTLVTVFIISVDSKHFQTTSKIVYSKTDDLFLLS